MTKNLEQVEILEGNSRPTKIQCTQSKKWVFTVNNYTETELEHLEQVFTDHDLAYMFSREMGEQGTPHLQGFLTAKKRMRPSELKFTMFHWSRVHWDKMRGTKEENVLYVTKSYDIGPWAKWVFSRQIQAPRKLVTLDESALRPWQREVVSWFKEYEDPLFGRTIHWVWESDGNMGKSVLATYLFDSGQDVAFVSGARKDMKFVIAEMVKGGTMPKIVLVDIPRVNKEHLSVAGIEEIKNGMFMSEKFESGFCRYNRPWVLCLANCPPNVHNFSMDRFKVYKLVDGELMHEDVSMYMNKNDGGYNC